MRHVADEHAVLAARRLTLDGVDDDDGTPAARGDRGQLRRDREGGAAAPLEAARLDHGDQAAAELPRHRGARTARGARPGRRAAHARGRARASSRGRPRGGACRGCAARALTRCPRAARRVPWTVPVTVPALGVDAQRAASGADVAPDGAVRSATRGCRLARRPCRCTSRRRPPAANVTLLRAHREPAAVERRAPQREVDQAGRGAAAVGERDRDGGVAGRVGAGGRHPADERPVEAAVARSSPSLAASCRARRRGRRPSSAATSACPPGRPSRAAPGRRGTSATQPDRDGDRREPGDELRRRGAAARAARRPRPATSARHAVREQRHPADPRVGAGAEPVGERERPRRVRRPVQQRATSGSRSACGACSSRRAPAAGRAPARRSRARSAGTWRRTG